MTKSVMILGLTAVTCLAAGPSSAPAPSTTRGDVLGELRLASRPAAPPKLLWVKKIWDAAPHNTFTDLVRFKGRFLCAFREAPGHVGGEGHIRVLASVDGREWTSSAEIIEPGIDLRDAKLSVAPDDRLMLLMGGSVWKGKNLVFQQTRVSFSEDGGEFSPIRRVYRPGWWLWRATWHKGVCYGMAYLGDAEAGKDSPEHLDLARSKDGVKWNRVRGFEIADQANEATLRFLPDDRMVALIRRDGGQRLAVLGLSAPPYTNWKLEDGRQPLGGPEFIILPDGQAWAAGRDHSDKTHTAVLRLDLDPATRLIVPSGGDTSYPGMVWHDGKLWMSYYAGHEGKCAIYLACMEVPAAK